jgi:hypothetical protein
MKKTLILIAIATGTATAIASTTTSAHADIVRLNARFAGGCVKSNTTGSCVIKVRADGYNFKRDALQLYSGSSRNSLKLASQRRRALAYDGHAIYRVKNIPGGCYQVRTAPNGNNRSDHASAVLCEK